MSVDKPRARNDIQSEISKREQDKSKRLKDTMKVVSDKKTQASTAKALKLSGTREGMEKVKRSFKKAEEQTDKTFNKQESDLQKRNFDPAKKLEHELRKRSDATQSDIRQMHRASGQIDTKAAKSEVRDAEKGAHKDKDFLDTSKKKQETDRTKGERERDKQKREIKGTRVTFRN